MHERVSVNEKINEYNILTHAKVKKNRTQGDNNYFNTDCAHFEELMGIVSKQGFIEIFLHTPTLAGMLGFIQYSSHAFAKIPNYLVAHRCLSNEEEILLMIPLFGMDS